MREIITDIEKLSNYNDDVNIKAEGEHVREVVLELKEIIREKGLLGLSAPQIGENLRMFVLNFSGDLKTFINPVILKAEGLEISRETCSSIPDKTYIRPRYSRVTIAYQTPLAEPKTCMLTGLASRMYQHHLDHLDGLLLPFIGLEIDEDFDNATEEEKAEVIKAYFEALDVKEKEVKEELSKDNILKQTDDAIDVLREVNKGKIMLNYKEATEAESALIDKKKAEFKEYLEQQKE